MLERIARGERSEGGKQDRNRDVRDLMDQLTREQRPAAYKRLSEAADTYDEAKHGPWRKYAVQVIEGKTP